MLITKHIWKVKFKDKFFVHPIRGVMKITNGWSKEKQVFKRKFFIFKGEFIYIENHLSKIEVEYVNEAGKVIKGYFYSKYRMNDVCNSILGWIDLFERNKSQYEKLTL